MIVHEGTPVREIGDVLRALLDGASDVANERAYLNSHLTPPEGYGFCWEEVLSMFFSYSSYPSGRMSY